RRKAICRGPRGFWESIARHCTTNCGATDCGETDCTHPALASGFEADGTAGAVAGGDIRNAVPGTTDRDGYHILVPPDARPGTFDGDRPKARRRLKWQPRFGRVPMRPVCSGVDLRVR